MNVTTPLSRVPTSQAPTAAVPTVCVVDDDVSVRESVELLVQSAGWQAKTYVCAMEFLASTRPSGPACLVLDVSLPDMNGLDLQQRLAWDGKNMPIVLVSGHGDVPTTVRAMKAGAVDFVTKPIDGDGLLAAIGHAIERSQAALQSEQSIRELRDREARLSRRERQVMERVVIGRLNKQIAWELEISEITVKAHRGKVMQKMDAKSVPQLVNMCARLSDQR